MAGLSLVILALRNYGIKVKLREIWLDLPAISLQKLLQTEKSLGQKARGMFGRWDAYYLS
jgi:hypothetical protein